MQTCATACKPCLTARRTCRRITVNNRTHVSIPSNFVEFPPTRFDGSEKENMRGGKTAYFCMHSVVHKWRQKEKRIQEKSQRSPLGIITPLPAYPMGNNNSVHFSILRTFLTPRHLSSLVTLVPLVGVWRIRLRNDQVGKANDPSLGVLRPGMAQRDTLRRQWQSFPFGWEA